jgi:putative transposase
MLQGLNCQDSHSWHVPGVVTRPLAGLLRCCEVSLPDGGGLSAAGRARREEVRLQAAEWLAEGVEPPEVARRLRVSSNSAYAWRRR